jgi:hypothetical protein
MPPKSKLRAVAEDEKAPVTPKTIGEAAEASERDLLVSLRTHLAREMDKGAVPAHALASVSAKIREYDRDIRAFDAREEQDGASDGDVVVDGTFDASAV